MLRLKFKSSWRQMWSNMLSGRWSVVMLHCCRRGEKWQKGETLETHTYGAAEKGTEDTFTTQRVLEMCQRGKKYTF